MMIDGVKMMFKEDWQNAGRILHIWENSWGTSILGNRTTDLEIKLDFETISGCG